jgi:TetR/AcrR family transcriptional regulator, tetracycline repressor protein
MLALSRHQVVQEALRLVDSDGLDGLTLRALATRLGVQAPTLYWHVRNKAELLDALGDEIMEDALGLVPDLDAFSGWQEWLLASLVVLRKTMLAHPDGARIVSGARASLRRADFSERAMTTLVARDVPLQRARLTVLAAERYTVGFVLEEQAPKPEVNGRAVDVGELRRRLPTATRAIIEYFESGRSVDDLFQDGVRLILGIDLDG